MPRPPSIPSQIFQAPGKSLQTIGPLRDSPFPHADGKSLARGLHRQHADFVVGWTIASAFPYDADPQSAEPKTSLRYRPRFCGRSSMMSSKSVLDPERLGSRTSLLHLGFFRRCRRSMRLCQSRRYSSRHRLTVFAPARPPSERLPSGLSVQ